MKIIQAVLIFVILTIYSCSSCNKEAANAPQETTLDSTLVPPQSVIVVPVNYRVSDLQTMINEKIKGTVLKKWIVLGERKDSLYLTITKHKNITLKRDGNTIYYNVPATISGSYIAKIGKVKIKNDTPVSMSVILKLATKFKMGSKWNLITDTQILDIVWEQDPSIRLAGVKVNLRPAFEKILTDKEAAITAKADEALQQLMSTRPIVNKLWLDIQKPIVINKKVKMVWLKPYCTEMTGRLLETDPDLISLQFELKALVNTYIEGDKIPDSNDKLPDFRQKINDNDSLVVYTHSSVKFDLLNDIIDTALSGKKFEKKGFEIVVKKVKVYGTHGGIAVKITTGGDLKSDLYATGKIQFDSSSKVVALRDFNFDLSTENAIASSAAWFLHSNILDLVKDKLAFNTEVLADKLPMIIMKAVEKGKTGQKIDINMGHLDVWPQQIMVTKKDIQLIVRATGKGSVDLEQKLFEGKKKNPSTGSGTGKI